MTQARMLTVVPLEKAEPRPRRVAIGSFDGVHLGHQAVIEGADTVLTFDPHPMQVTRPEFQPELITPFSVKRDLIEGLGVAELVVINFDRSFAQHTAEDFIERILIEKLAARQVSVGENFRFGKGAKGDAEMLSAHPEFATEVVPLIEIDGATVSSTRIRDLIRAGEMEQAQRCLGSPFIFEGAVVAGDRRGRELGFPTANLVPEAGFVAPAFGVYAAFANGHPAAVNVGVRPTFDSDRGCLIEAHLIDFDGDLYGQTLRLAFASRLRGEERFERVEDLVAQMGRDVEAVRRICASFQP